MAGKLVENISILDDSILIDEGTSPVGFKRRSARHFSQSAKKECTQLCEYPIGNSNSDTVTVHTSDYATLEHDTFLNDIVIDFYLTYLFYNSLPPESRDSVHIFSTMFYKRLLQFPNKKTKKVAPYEIDPSLSSAEKRHFRVAGWTKNVDLFTKDMVIVPICEHSHWYLVILIKPGLISLPVKSVERVMKGDPFVIVLDSLGGSKNSAVNNLRQYLAQEWKNKMCTGQDTSEEFEFSAREMRTIHPSKPEQDNGSDCGLFLLHYVENMFKNVEQFLWPTLPDISDWFTVEEVAWKRKNIAELLRTLASEQRPGVNLNFPKIKFVTENISNESSIYSASFCPNSPNIASKSFNLSDMATSSLGTSNIASTSSGFTAKNFATSSAGPSTKFSEVRNACKEKQKGHDYVSVCPVAKKKDENPKRKRRPGLETFKRLQLATANSRNASLNEDVYVPEQNN